ncbi:MAG: glycosyl transferase family 1 [Candidatus Amesbacteria bacterium GW2011_GWB1_47_19]|nr:MAG: glycosyl transferase family 1 [Candidatus Amesbacteria bacterium GW2011_GWA1_44_24]KKU31741.1 MAG: Glycosyltransferase [Candidatus Amesbacteria bacterium GW2011_GWC1_46_24]KKU67654.1 MAG: glycosyl transferase family 1 [Candidatus Amesbacteria bacterium GW2011_GWB1_47_19]OGD06504.1 MAG: hypothetical protein A2379_02580 [Candidatus Amesbacteria bacterium RIFOXYB1_FULL_47_13]HBC72907.1 hypothetical protein [Candidatus Amesbacteria bacterium]
MKISFLSVGSGQVNRGAESFVHYLANHLSRLDHQITVHQNGDPLINCTYRTESYHLDSFSIRDFTAQVLKNIGSPDILIPVNGRWQSGLCRLWAFRNKTKMVISGQSGLGLDDRINLYTCPDAFVALSNYQLNWAKRINPFVRVVRIPNGVDPEIFHPSAEKVNIELPRPIILCVSALEENKRLHLAVKAVAGMRRGSLLIIGRGSLINPLTSLGMRLLPGRFSIMSLPQHLMPGVFTAADLFTYPTVAWESFGIALLEAMASGLAIVANNDPIRREIVGDAGLFADPSDSGAYTSTLNQALSYRWGKKPLLRAQKYAWSKIVLDYDKLFKTICYR